MPGPTSQPTSWRQSFQSFAAGASRVVREREARFDWTMSVIRHASLWLIILVVLILFFPPPDFTALNAGNIALLLGAYAFFVLILKVAAGRGDANYDSEGHRTTFVVVNALVVSALVYMSGGENSYFWLFYLLPLFQAVVYFGAPGALFTAAAVIVSFWAVSVLLPARPKLGPDYTRLTINSLVLLQLTYAFRWFIGSAKENKELQFNEMDALRRTALQITSQLEREALLKLIIKRAVELLKAVNAGIYLYDPGTEELTVITDLGGQKSIRGHKLKVGQGLAGLVAETKKPQRVEDYGKWPHRSPELEPDLFRAVVEVPLEVEGHFLGVLYVTDIARGRTFSVRDERLLNLLGSHAAIAIHNAEVFAENQRNLNKLTLLNNVSENINSALTLNDILRATLKEALKAVRTDEGSIMVLDPKTQQLEIEAWIVEDEFKDEKPDRKFNFNEGIAGRVAATRQARIWSDTDDDGEFLESFTGRVLRSILCVPIVSNDRLLCIINADSDQPDFFKESDKDLLSALATHVALAIESQRLRDVGRSLSTHTTEQLYGQIVETACYLTSAEASSLFLVQDKNEFVRASVFPLSLSAVSDSRQNDGLTRKIVEEQRHMTINNAQTHPLVKPSIKARGVKALMGAPLNILLEQNGEKTVTTLGVLFVSTTQDTEFTPRDADIHQTLANQAAIAVANEKLIEYQQSLIASALDAIVSIDRYGRIQEFNPSAEHILGWKREEVRGQHVSMLYANKIDGTRVARKLLKPENDGRVIDFPTALLTKNEERIDVRLTAKLLENGSVGFFQDQREIESVRRHIEQLKGLLEAGKEITEPDDLQLVVKAAVKKALSNLNADVVCLYSYDDVRQEIRLPPIREGDLLDDEVPLDVGPNLIVENVIEYGREHHDIYFTDDAPTSMLAGAFVEREKIKAVAACPLAVKNKIVGVMFCNYRNRSGLSDEEKAVIRVFAGEAAIAIDNAQLYEDTRKKAELLHALARAIPGLADDIPYEGNLRSVLKRACELTHAQLGALALISREDQRKFEPFITYGVDPVLLRMIGRTPLVGHGFLGDLLEGKQVINVPQYMNSSDAPDHHPHVSNFLGVPIVHKGTSLGNIYVANKQTADRFSQDDERGLMLLAALVALYVKSEAGEVSDGDDETFNLTSLLLSRWAHNVRHITSDISSELTKLRSALLGTNHEASLNKISRSVGDLSAPSRQIQLSPRDSGQATFSLSLLLERAVAQLSPGHEVSIKVVTQIEPYCLVKGNRLLLEFVLNILLDNAVEAIKRTGRPGTLRIECARAHGMVRVRVCDTGDGISPKVREDLFQRPASLSPNAKGYASYTAASIVKMHKGEIRVVRTMEEEGTVIEFQLPGRAQ